MNSEFWILFSGVCIAGLLTSVSPCPMAANIAAVSYIGRQVSSSRKLLLSGILYACGRMTAYTILAICILSLTIGTGESIIRVFSVGVNFWIGPPMILLGMALIGMFTFSFGTLGRENSAMFVERLGLFSAFPLGMVFALAFCPTSAAMFLTALGLAATAKSVILFPCGFGIATSVPVLLFAIILAFLPRYLNSAFTLLTRIDWWTRNAAGTVFIVLGVYFSLMYVWLI